LKTNGETDADGADANCPPRSAWKDGHAGLEDTAVSAAEALKAARAPGIGIGIDGDALALEAVTAPPPAVLYLLA